MKTIRITESDLQNIVRRVICETIEESGYLQGAHKATLDNLNRKKDMGQLFTIRPNGKRIDNKERLIPLDKHNESMNKDFFSKFGDSEVIIPFSVELNNNFIYNFDFKLKQIENIDTRYISLLGDMTITKTCGNPESFMRAYSPKSKTNVVVKYDFGAHFLKYPRNPKGLVIRPALNTDGTNNSNWNFLIEFATDYLKGNQRYSRP